MSDKKVRAVFGLEAQGHIPKIEKMLKEWYPRCSDENPLKIWDEIASEIGWIGFAVCQDYIKYLKRNQKSIKDEGD